ncbi:AraC family transcriptional regulator [Nevskia soli]|uniref:AraC family transcriptional regulator n=1 Tax=Nevskia soli TaxID=418856 RepID=UPI0004A72ADA|nr:AraC family transcriptional regulator [Nevskia soli]
MNFSLEAARLHMVELIRSLVRAEGLSASGIPGVQLMHGTRCMPRTPVVYEPGIAILVQGRKRGYLSGHEFVYDQRNYLVTSVPMPFEVETEASPELPLYGVKVKVEMTTLAELLLEMDDRLPESATSPRGIYATPLNEDMSSAVIRLLECLATPVDARILGPQIVREIVYRVLCGEQGGALRALATRHSHCGRIGKVLRQVHANFSSPLDVETMADEASMSVSAFHHHFKAVTSSSPLQYLKTIRLHQARLLMVQEGLSAGIAAQRVGYESPSQFSREFKRLFGSNPSAEAARVRATL